MIFADLKSEVSLFIYRKNPAIKVVLTQYATRPCVTIILPKQLCLMLTFRVSSRLIGVMKTRMFCQNFKGNLMLTIVAALTPSLNATSYAAFYCRGQRSILCVRFLKLPGSYCLVYFFADRTFSWLAALIPLFESRYHHAILERRAFGKLAVGVPFLGRSVSFAALEIDFFY